jgi:hypothetical protein
LAILIGEKMEKKCKLKKKHGMTKQFETTNFKEKRLFLMNEIFKIILIISKLNT